MLLCSNTLRALSRSRLPPSKSLLPFLYQTATIQQWKPATQPHARRSISSRLIQEDDIPFEDLDGDLPPAIDGATSGRKTTITGTERAAFEKLYKTFKGQGRPKADNGELEELDQVADEYYEEDEEAATNSLDKVFDAVLQGSPRSPQAQKDNAKTLPQAKNSASAAELVKDASMAGPETAQGKKKLAAKAEREKIKTLRTEERERVDALLKTAPTDKKLWQVLEKEVFDQLRDLNLDGTNATKKSPSKGNKSKSKSKATTTLATDRRVLFPNYPHYLHVALLTLRAHFPSSQMPLTILPTLKSLGRSSYALGATTTLYKHLLRTAWIQQSSYSLIDTLLTDMDSNMVEFDSGILELLDAIIKEHDMARGGGLGREMQMVYGMEQWVEGITKIKEWREVVTGRLGIKRPEDSLSRVVRRPVERPERVRRDAVAMPMDVPLVERRNGADKTAQNATAIPFVRERNFDTTYIDARSAPSTEYSQGEQVDYDMETRQKILL
jgi:hypothetical protein